MPHLTIIQKLAISSLYQQGSSSIKLASEFMVSDVSIRNAIRACGGTLRDKHVCHRKYKHDDSVFDVLNEQSAYWVGFLMADGYISKEGRLEVGIHRKDEGHVVKLREFLKSNHPITYGTNKNGTPTVKFNLRSPKITTALAGYGVVNKKSLTATAAVCLEDNPHFWRGEIDGDGCIQNKSNCPYLSLLGSYNICASFFRFCLSVSFDTDPYMRKFKTIYKTSVSGNAAMKLLRCLYPNANEYLNRKYKHAMCIINKHGNRVFRHLPKERKNAITPY